MTALAGVFVEGRIKTDRFGPDIKSGMNSSQVRAATGQAGKDAGGRFSSSFKSALKIGAAVAAAAAVAGGAKLLKASVSEASNLGESLNAINVTFGKSAAGIKRLGREAADAVGLSATQFNSLAVQFSSFATTIAGPGGNVTKTMDELTTRGADFASVMNLDVNDAMAKFRSGLAGEAEPLRQFGIDLSATAVELHAIETGLINAGDKMTEQQKVQARYSLLMQQTAKTQGDFANTSDSLANSQRRLGAHFDNIQAKIGAKLIPVLEDFAGWVLKRGLPALERFGGWFQRVVTPRVEDFTALVRREVVPVVKDLAARFMDDALPALKDFGAWVQRNQAWLIPLTGGILAAVGAFKAFMFIKTAIAAVKLFTVAVKLNTLALLANPLGLVIAALAGLATGLYLAYKKSETFRKIVNGVFDAVKDGGLSMAQFVTDKTLWMVEKVIGFMAKIPGPTQDAFKAAERSVSGLRKHLNSEFDAMQDEEVKVKVTAVDGVRTSIRVAERGGATGGAGGHGSLGAFGGARLRPRLDSNTSGLDSAAARIAETAQAIGAELAKSMTFTAKGTAGRVLPRGSYSIGMPYLGYPGHYGADYPAPAGTPVFAAAAGIVSRAASLIGSYGKHIFLGHPGGRETRYAHLSQLLVQPGQMVAAGQMIGRVGSTGNSTGNHLHYEDRLNGVARNPAGLGLFDTGGLLKHGGVAMNLSGKPERVLDPQHTKWFEEATEAAKRRSGGRGGGVQRIVLDVGGGRTLTGIIQDEIDGRESFTHTTGRMR